MYYAVHGKNWFAVRTTDAPTIEYETSSMSNARSFAMSLNLINIGHTPGTFIQIPDSHRYFVYMNPLQIRDSFVLDELAAYPSRCSADVLDACVGLNNGSYRRNDFNWTSCTQIDASTGSGDDSSYAEQARRVPKTRLSFVRAGYIWSNHGTVWFWAEEEPEWNGSVYTAKKKSQFNLPWVQYKKTWTGAYESLAKVEK